MKIYKNNSISFLFNNYDNRYLPSRYKERTCIYRTLLNIKFTKKIKNVTLATEDGTKLEEYK